LKEVFVFVFHFISKLAFFTIIAKQSTFITSITNLLPQMKILYTLLIFSLSISLFSCNTAEAEKVEDLIQDDIDSSTIKYLGPDTTKKVSEVQEFKENLKVIEKKYGEQWGFCECVVANDSVNDAIIKSTVFEGKKFDNLMLRSDFITQKCQAFLSMDSSKTPEERSTHEKKVKKCLKEAKKKK